MKVKIKITCSDQISNVSYGRYPDGDVRWYYFSTASPGTTNNTQPFDGQVADTTFNPDRGFYDADINVELATATTGATPPSATVR